MHSKISVLKEIKAKFRSDGGPWGEKIGVCGLICFSLWVRNVKKKLGNSLVTQKIQRKTERIQKRFQHGFILKARTGCCDALLRVH